MEATEHEDEELLRKIVEANEAIKAAIGAVALLKLYRKQQHERGTVHNQLWSVVCQTIIRLAEEGRALALQVLKEQS